MSRRAPLRFEVARAIDRYLGLIASEGGPRLRGLYLVGSIALGDYRVGASDIDFVALLDAEPNAEETDALARIHAALARVGGPPFDGVYLPAEALKRPPVEGFVAPFVVEGRFRSGEICPEVTPVVWRCLARSGRAILGSAPVSLAIADDDAALRAYCLAHLDTYWRGWVAEREAALGHEAEGGDCDAAALAWGLLGLGRTACTLATGRIVSKRDGGRHALAILPETHRAVVHEALGAHFGDVERVPQATMREGLATMRFLIDAAAGRQTQAPVATPSER